MAAYDYDIGVIGGGAAGLTVAAGAAKLGARTLLVEKEDKLGGDCLHFGCVPSKTLIKSASVYHLMRHGQAFGLPSLKVPPVDFSRIAARIQSVIEAIQHHDSPERFCSLGAKVEFGPASFLDPHAVDIAGKRVTARRWVIATGSSPAVPPIPGLDSVDFLTNKNLFTLDALPKSMIVLGGGPIACEMAQAFQRLGTAVEIVQRSGQILRREDKDMADTVMNSMAKDGVVVHLRSAIAEIRQSGGGKEVVIVADGQKHVLGAEQLLVAMGRSPNTHGLNLENAGVDHDAGGIAVDARLRTSQPHIFAAGDVNGRFQFTHAAGYEGGVVIANAIFKLPRKADYAFMPWCTYTDPELASIGMNEQAAERAGKKFTVYVERFKDNDRAWAEGEVKGKIKLVLDEREKPLGVQIVGPHAGEIISEWVAALAGKVKLTAIASAAHPYPTLSEINKRAASAVFADKLFSAKVRKTLQFLFHYKGRACSEE